MPCLRAPALPEAAAASHCTHSPGSAQHGCSGTGCSRALPALPAERAVFVPREPWLRDPAGASPPARSGSVGSSRAGQRGTAGHCGCSRARERCGKGRNISGKLRQTPAGSSQRMACALLSKEAAKAMGSDSTTVHRCQ